MDAGKNKYPEQSMLTGTKDGKYYQQYELYYFQDDGIVRTYNDNTPHDNGEPMFYSISLFQDYKKGDTK
jgi:hypothetical protein